MLIESSPLTAAKSQGLRHRWAPAIALLALCLPTLLFVWINRDVPHFGVLQDDGMYFIDGKTMAQNAGYRILSLPAQPHETRYPPLYPLLLSAGVEGQRQLSCHAHRGSDAFLAVFTDGVAAGLLVVRGAEFSVPIAWLTLGLFALNPYVLFFVSNLGSEMMFMVFLFGAMAIKGPSEMAGGCYCWPACLRERAI